METPVDAEVAPSVVPQLISYRQLLPSIFDYLGTALVMIFMAIISILVGVLAIIVVGTVLVIAAVLAGVGGVSLGILIPLGVGILALCTWWHMFASQMAMVRGVLLEHSAAAYLDDLKFVYAHWWRVVLLVGVVQLLVATGFVLFLLPGVVAAIYLGFALFSFMTETPRIRHALARSMVLVHGRFWPLLGRYAYIIALTSVVLLAALFMSFVWKPLVLFIPLIFIFAALGNVVLFRSLQKVAPLRAEHPTILTKQQTWLFAIVAIFGFIILLTFSIFFDHAKPDESRSTPSLVDALRDAELSGALVSLRRELEVVNKEASIQHAATGNYSGVCSQEGKAAELIAGLRALSANETVDCMASENAYAFEILLKNGDFLCLDSSGVVGVFYTPRVAPDLCNAPLP